MTYWWTSKELVGLPGLPKTQRGVNKRATLESWPHRTRAGRGGGREYPLHVLPPETQVHIVEQLPISDLSALMADMDLQGRLDPQARWAAMCRLGEEASATGGFSSGFSSGIPAGGREQDKKGAADGVLGDVPAPLLSGEVRDTQLQRRLAAVSRALSPPSGWAKSLTAWRQLVAAEEKVAPSTLYRWLQLYQQGGPAALVHGNRRSRRGKAYAWDKEAVDYWIGLVLKREHRKMSIRALYARLMKVAEERGWRIGGWESARILLRKRVPAPVLAYRDGGIRALDNALPAIRRAYEDLAPFEIIVGDQHRFDFWVRDDEDPHLIYRPEGYVWQDLCTRIIYGFSIGRRYDAYMMGHALWVGLKVYGKFGTVYTDHGRPETSAYILKRKGQMKLYGMEHDFTLDRSLTPEDMDAPASGSGVLADLGAGQRLAVVRNAKAKMIESTFRVVESLLRDHGVPGYTHSLGGDLEERRVDDAELERLKLRGKLLTLSEFLCSLIEVFDYYNARKNHRGLQDQVMRETGKRPRHCSPRDYLRFKMASTGWRPTYISDRALDIIFLARAHRKVQSGGRIQFQYRWYEAEELLSLAPGTRVELRYDPYDLDRPLIVLRGGDYLCDAVPISYSSMKDSELTRRKIEEKRRLRSRFVEMWRRYTSKVADVRVYSETPQERLAETRRKALEHKAERALEDGRRRRPEEHHLEMIEALEREIGLLRSQISKLRPVVPARPDFFMTDHEHYEWCKQVLLAGEELSSEDRAFVEAYHGRHPHAREYLEIERENLSYEIAKKEEKIGRLKAEIKERRALLKGEGSARGQETARMEMEAAI